jgi:NADH dehydrogenase [ubiquinone] 1 alpha subcomplex assembly factor 5
MAASEASPSELFDRRAWRLHRDRAARLCGDDFLFAEVGRRLLDRLDDVGRGFGRVLDLGARSGALSRALAERPETELVVAAEPSHAFLARGEGLRLAADPELLPLREKSFDLVVSNLVLHWAGDLPGALVQLRRALVPDGFFLAAMLGGRTLAELREVLIEAELAEEGGASPRVSPMADLADAAHLLQRARFAMPVADGESLSVSYPDALSLMRELRALGETNALLGRRRAPLNRRTLARAAALYAERFGDLEGRISATFEVFFLAGWAPHPGQPQPLKPGSGQRRLAEALGTVEISAGDRTRPRRQNPSADRKR